MGISMLVYNTLLPYTLGVIGLSALVIPTVTFVRGHILVRMDGLEVPLFAAVVGNGLVFGFAWAASAAGHPLGWTPVSEFAFGTLTGFWSSGFVKGVKSWSGTWGGKLIEAASGVLAGLLPKGVAAPQPGDTPAGDAGNSPTPPSG